jgi:hypothetical protein
VIFTRLRFDNNPGAKIADMDPTITENEGVFSVTLKQDTAANAEKLLNFNKILEEQGICMIPDLRKEEDPAQASESIVG